MTPVQLAKAECCNYFSTGPYHIKDYCCLEPNPGGEDAYRCLVVVGSRVPCEWFQGAVVDRPGQVMEDYERSLQGQAPPARPLRRARCAICNEEFHTAFNRAAYCSDGCRREARRRQSRMSKRRQRQRRATSDSGGVSTIGTPANPHDKRVCEHPSGGVCIKVPALIANCGHDEQRGDTCRPQG